MPLPKLDLSKGIPDLWRKLIDGDPTWDYYSRLFRVFIVTGVAVFILLGLLGPMLMSSATLAGPPLGFACIVASIALGYLSVRRVLQIKEGSR